MHFQSRRTISIAVSALFDCLSLVSTPNPANQSTSSLQSILQSDEASPVSPADLFNRIAQSSVITDTKEMDNSDNTPKWIERGYKLLSKWLLQVKKNS